MISPDFDLKIFFAAILITTPMFFLGLYLQTKIIKTVKSERAMTWEINACHSMFMIVHYTYTLAFEVFAYVLPSMSEYTGEWFCYAMFFVRGYGLFSIALHSLMICLYKYMFIVHGTLLRMLGEDRIKKIILAIYLINPIFTSVSFMARSPYLEPSPTLERCGVHRSINSYEDVMEDKRWKRTFFCGIDDDKAEGFDYLLYIINQCYCFFQTLAFFGSLVNIFEAFMYYKIFQYMKR